MSRSVFIRLSTAARSSIIGLVTAVGRRGVQALPFGLCLLWAGSVDAELILRLSGLVDVKSHVAATPKSPADWYDADNPSPFHVDLAWDDTLNELSVSGDSYYVPLNSDPSFFLQAVRPDESDLSGNALREGDGLDMKIVLRRGAIAEVVSYIKDRGLCNWRFDRLVDHERNRPRTDPLCFRLIFSELQGRHLPRTA